MIWKGKKLLIGIGNSARQYTNTRHSIGLEFIKFATSKKLPSSLIPLSSNEFMNLSGKFVQKSICSHQIKDPSSEVIIVCDDLEQQVGCWKFKETGSANGHNGLKSIFQILGTQKIPRLLIGISRPATKDPAAISEYVLSRMPLDEKKKISEEVFVKIVTFLNEK